MKNKIFNISFLVEEKLMPNDEKSNPLRGPWIKPEAYIDTSLLESELQRQADAIFALEDSRVGSLQSPDHWIRTKKNGAKTSKIGINTWDVILILALILVLVVFAAGYQFSLWDWVCQEDACKWISDALTAKGE